MKLTLPNDITRKSRNTQLLEQHEQLFIWWKWLLSCPKEPPQVASNHTFTHHCPKGRELLETTSLQNSTELGGYFNFIYTLVVFS